ncbi:glycosyltransferase family 2 protein [Candidatus Dojkabacteria bacterium]|nr:glycosyltransferase family 2 protein [Candidatus Dojkabacteria bacterium]
MKSIAIIIVNYNSFSEIKELSESLNQYSLDIFDVFIVDNNSLKDNELEMNKFCQKNKYFFIKSKENHGFASGVNIGIKKAMTDEKYKYFMLLNPDTILEDPKFFDQLTKDMEETKAAIIGPLVRYYPEKDTIYCAGGSISKISALNNLVGKGSKDFKKFSTIRECDFISGGSMLISRELLDKIPSFPEEYFLFFEEADFCMNAKKLGYKVIFTPNTYLYHKHSQSISYMSDLYLYYSIRNYRIFAFKYLQWYFLPVFMLVYLTYWCGGYAIKAIQHGNIKGILQIFKALLNLKFK